MVHEVYDALFFSPYLLFPLEGKCHVVAKGCTGQSTEVTLHHFPDRQSAAPPSEAMHSEHILHYLTTVHTDFAGWRLTGFAGRGAPL